jgi:NAD(P)-dependent dehydrogenase (short-subunit alcohol dehydrogenase family)
MINFYGFVRFFVNLIVYPFAVIFLIFYRCLQWIGIQPLTYDYQDSLVFITGSGNGLGREIALAFANAGASLALCDIDDIGKKYAIIVFHSIRMYSIDLIETGNRETQQQCLAILDHRKSSSRVRTYHLDVTRSADVNAVALKVRHELGQVTILVANAGFVSGRSLLTESDADTERTFQVNSISPIWLLKAFLPYMLDANRGRIILISSVLGNNEIFHCLNLCVS